MCSLVPLEVEGEVVRPAEAALTVATFERLGSSVLPEKMGLGIVEVWVCRFVGL